MSSKVIVSDRKKVIQIPNLVKRDIQKPVGFVEVVSICNLSVWEEETGDFHFFFFLVNLGYRAKLYHKRKKKEEKAKKEEGTVFTEIWRNYRDLR